MIALCIVHERRIPPSLYPLLSHSFYFFPSSSLSVFLSSSPFLPPSLHPYLYLYVFFSRQCSLSSYFSSSPFPVCVQIYIALTFPLSLLRSSFFFLPLLFQPPLSLCIIFLGRLLNHVNGCSSPPFIGVSLYDSLFFVFLGWGFCPI